MTLKWYDGAEVWANSTYASRAYASASGYGVGTPGRVSPGARYISQSAAGVLTTPSLGSTNTWVVGFGFYCTVAGFKLKVLRSSSEQCRIECFANGGNFEFRLYRNTTLIGTSSVFAGSTWHFFEFKVTVRGSPNGVYELRRNESSILSGSGVGLTFTGSDGADAFTFENAGASAVRLDDIYILDDAGSIRNDFLGEVVAFESLPTAEGHQNDFTPSTGTNNAALVDDPSTTASNTDYASSDTNAQEDYYDMAAMPATGIGQILALKLSASLAMATAGSRTIRYRSYVAATEYTEGANQVVNGTSLVELPVISEQNQNTAADWTKSDVDAAEFGIEVVS